MTDREKDGDDRLHVVKQEVETVLIDGRPWTITSTKFEVKDGDE